MKPDGTLIVTNQNYYNFRFFQSHASKCNMEGYYNYYKILRPCRKTNMLYSIYDLSDILDSWVQLQTLFPCLCTLRVKPLWWVTITVHVSHFFFFCVCGGGGSISPGWGGAMPAVDLLRGLNLVPTEVKTFACRPRLRLRTHGGCALSCSCAVADGVSHTDNVSANKQWSISHLNHNYGSAFRLPHHFTVLSWVVPTTNCPWATH